IYDTTTSISESATKITLDNTTATIVGAGAYEKENTITITNNGDYYITGSYIGQLVIDADDKIVHIMLDNVSITSNISAPIYIKNSKKTVITLVNNNSISDNSNHSVDSNNEPDGCLFSDDDLTINGTGTLNINALYQDGIVSKDGLKIINGTYNIKANDDGVRGKDYVYIKTATFSIESGMDGIKSTNDTNSDLGYILIESGDYNIISNSDAIQAETTLQIKDGTYNLTTGAGSTTTSVSSLWNNGDSTKSSKGLKGANNIIIDNGKFIIDSEDDSIHSNNTITINQATFTISSGDDGIHADSNITINNGDITINKSYEGVESSNITINNGSISINASDDGINVAGGNDASSQNRPGANTNVTTTNQNLTINNGYVYISSVGDGIDVNGAIYQNGGTIIINGPSDNANGILDFDTEFIITQGTLIAAGSSGMLQLPTSSHINVVYASFNTMPANTLINLSTSDTSIITFAPSKSYQAIIFATPNIKSSLSYTLSSGGEVSGTHTNGIYDGIYQGGSVIATKTIKTTLTAFTTTNNNFNSPGR
ncbi:MAG: carbohydrate-binding domain-containing protein, partial [bacterium]|nr:carbohydrate-binding domain-containing protein [bacterium]